MTEHTMILPQTASVWCSSCPLLWSPIVGKTEVITRLMVGSMVRASEYYHLLMFIWSSIGGKTEVITRLMVGSMVRASEYYHLLNHNDNSFRPLYSHRAVRTWRVISYSSMPPAWQYVMKTTCNIYQPLPKFYPTIISRLYSVTHVFKKLRSCTPSVCFSPSVSLSLYLYLSLSLSFLFFSPIFSSVFSLWISLSFWMSLCVLAGPSSKLGIFHNKPEESNTYRGIQNCMPIADRCKRRRGKNISEHFRYTYLKSDLLNAFFLDQVRRKIMVLTE